jgi:hypothetical protein
MMANFCEAQINIVINKPQSFQVKVSDMFNADVINMSGQPIKLYIVGTIINTKTNQKVVQGTSQALEFGVGSKHINENILSPSYTYSSSAVEQTGYLPYGNYHICLNAYSAADNEPKGDGCIDEEITPLSPPLLLSPENGSTINTTYPLLIWLPPTPVNNRMGVLYDLKLVELTDNQTAYDAIQRNFSVFEQQNLTTTNLQYPANAIQLQDGKTYAWKILAKTNDGTLIGETEVWMFKLEFSNAPIENKIKTNTYAKLTQSNAMNTCYETDSGVLNFSYVEKYKAGILNYKIYDENNKNVTPKSIIRKEYGENAISIDLKNTKGFTVDKIYQLVVTNDKSETYKLTFKYNK